MNQSANINSVVNANAIRTTFGKPFNVYVSETWRSIESLKEIFGSMKEFKAFLANKKA